jgi:hypothetical protein
MRQAQLHIKNGNQKEADVYFERAGNEKAEPLAFVGLATKTGKLVHPTTGEICGEVQPGDLTYPASTIHAKDN